MNLIARKKKLLMQAGQGYTAHASVFDGSTDYLDRGGSLTGVSDGTTGIMSIWFKPAAITATHRLFHAGNTFLNLISNGSLVAQPTQAAAPFARLGLSTAASAVTTSVWYHVLASWNTNYSAGNKIGHLYLNGSNALASVNDTSGAFFPDQSSNGGIGAAAPSGVLKFSGEICEVYFAPNQFLDFSVGSNREKFRSPSGKPVSLGADGSLPTGVTPAVYLKSSAASFGVNSGGGGNFTVNGTLGVGTPP